MPKSSPKKKVAVILFNLGGPLSLEGVHKFLLNLFYDPAIVRIPSFFRFFLAHYLSIKRAPIAKKIYKYLGGKSPLLENTIAQEKALYLELKKDKYIEYKTFISMRYAAPRASDLMKDLIIFSPDEIIFLPLYPQSSTATTASSFDEMFTLLKNEKSLKKVIVKALNQYPNLSGFIEAQADKIQEVFDKNSFNKKVRILYSAHGLPMSIVRAGDNYPKQVKITVSALNKRLKEKGYNFKSTLCYQSKVGPVKWLEPSVEYEIIRAAKEGVPIVIVPVSFVSEHSETLYELDVEYKKLADKEGVVSYSRVGTVSDSPIFIQGLATKIKGMVRDKI